VTVNVFIMFKKISNNPSTVY